MRLTRYTDYALRVLLFLGARPDKPCAISGMAKAYGISQNHLMKVVHGLGKAGYVVGERGRLGGIRLAKPAAAINIGAIIRLCEEDFDLVDCATCAIGPACGLTGVLDEAVAAFMAVLDRYSLADLLGRRGQVLQLLAIEPG